VSALRSTKLALVEGKDEINFYSALAVKMGLAGVEIQTFAGVNNLRGTLDALRGVEGFDQLVALGIVRDAEGDGVAALQSVRDALRATNFAVPTRGLERVGANPAVVVLINPHDEPNGRFEDVCIRSVVDTEVMKCADAYVNCLKRLGTGKPTREWKTRVHAYIAAQDHPEVSLGVAARYGYFPLDHAAFVTVRRLFELLEAP
jgi:uncharacterized protein DUF3226